ncbi:hypothetical protein D9M68_794750 [compost metagenome]
MAQPLGSRRRVEVGTCTEATARPGQHHGTNLRITRLVPGVGEIAMQLTVERVQTLGSIERHQKHGTLAFAQDGVHSAAPVPRMAVT